MMLSLKENVVPMLRHRELSIRHAPSFWSKRIVRQLISSDKDLYGEKYTKSSYQNISLKNGCIFFDYYKKFCSVNSINTDSSQSPHFFLVDNSKGGAICSPIYYAGSSNCLISISGKGFLCKHSTINGKLMNSIYIKRTKYISHGELNWNLYGKSFSFIGGYFNERSGNLEKVEYLVVLTFPMEYYIFIEIKDAIFGEDVTSIKLCNQLLMVVYSTHVAVYQFDELLREGTITPYRLGDVYKNKSKIGSYPTGLPPNFTYDEAPPLLFKVEENLIDMVCINGYISHYITVHPKENDYYPFHLFSTFPFPFHRKENYDACIVSAGKNTPIKSDPWSIEYCDEDYLYTDVLKFHPDKSNRVIVKRRNSIDCYKIISEKDNLRVSRQFSFQLLDESRDKAVIDVLKFDYEAELDIFAILARRRSDSTAFVKLYDNITGESLRTIELKGVTIYDYFEPTYVSKLHIYSFAIAVIVRNPQFKECVHVYMM